MIEVDIDVSSGSVVPVRIAPTAVGGPVFTGGGVLAGWSLRDATAVIPNQTEGTVAAPGAGAVIAQLTNVPAGTYNVNWAVTLAGALAAADTNNLVLFVNAGNVQVAIALPVAGEYPQEPVEIVVPSLATVGVKAIAVATAGTAYTAQFAISPTLELESIVEIQDGGNVLGEFSSGSVRAWTQWFGKDGPYLNSGVQLAVVSGAVTGCIYVIPSSP
jgi:hypothetical protein